MLGFVARRLLYLVPVLVAVSLLTFLIASLAIWLVGVETKGRVLEQITGPAKTA